MYRNFYFFSEPTDKYLFGKHKGESFESVMESDPKYITWCINELEEFFLTPELRNRIRQSHPEIANNPNLDGRNTSMYWNPGFVCDEPDEDYYYEDRETYDRYAGSYAQDVAGFSDEAIDEVFDGDPDMYWNID